jgi:hypothetical protein
MTRQHGVQCKALWSIDLDQDRQSPWHRFIARIAVKSGSTLNRIGSSLTRKVDCR